jgi:hypothetical protein
MALERRSSSLLATRGDLHCGDLTNVAGIHGKKHVHTFETVVEFDRTHETAAGLWVKAKLDKRTFATGRLVTKTEMRTLALHPRTFQGTRRDRSPSHRASPSVGDARRRVGTEVHLPRLAPAFTLVVQVRWAVDGLDRDDLARHRFRRRRHADARAARICRRIRGAGVDAVQM